MTLTSSRRPRIGRAHPLRRRRRSVRAALVGGLLAVVAAGCVPWGDPATSSLIVNDTASPVEVEVILDQTQWRFGFEPDEYEVWLSERTDDWIRNELEQYGDHEGGDEGAELVAVDTARWAGTYRIAPSGTMVVDGSLGDGPNVRFSELAVTTAEGVERFVGQEEILSQFEEIEDGEFEFRIGRSD